VDGFYSKDERFINWLDDLIFSLKMKGQESSLGWLIWEERGTFLFSLCMEDKCVYFFVVELK
jgi:hypothetical protein